MSDSKPSSDDIEIDYSVGSGDAKPVAAPAPARAPGAGATVQAGGTIVTPAAPKQSKIAAWLARKWLAILIVVFALIFILSNLDVIGLKFLAFTITAPMWMFSAVLFAAGLLTGIVLAHRKRTPKDKK